MTRRHSPLQQLKEAKQIARDHGLFVVEKAERDGTSYLLYREQQPTNTLIGRRSSPSGIRNLVCKVANFH